MSKHNEKIIERLKKLFALGQSSNQHEAELAMSMANKLMTEYQISATDIDLSEEGDIVREEYRVEGAERSTFLQLLADAAAIMYDAKCNRLMGKHGALVLRFYGTPADILASKMTFEHLHKSWKSIVELALLDNDRLIDKRVFKRSHGTGFANAIYNRCQHLASQRQKEVVSATGRDLVLVKGVALQNFLSNVKIRNTYSSNSLDNGAYHKGQASGNNVPLHGALKNEDKLRIGHK